MFRAAPDTEVATPVATSEPIPLSILSLDLPVPVEGWPVFLGRRGIAIIPDSLGRDSIGHDAARRLLDEKRADDLRKAAQRAAAEKAAVEADRQWRSQLPHGLPWYEVPDGVLPVVAMTQAARDAQPKRLSPLQEALSGETMTVHALPRGDES